MLSDGVEQGVFAVTDLKASARAIFDATSRFHHPAHAEEWSEAELAARIDASQASPVQFTLIEALKGLAKGDLVAINATPLPPTDTIADDGVGNAAVLALYFRLLVGVRSLASGLLAIDGAEPDLAIQVFRDIQKLSSAVAPADGWLGNEVGAFAGPHHLACLLIAVAGDLAGSAVTAVNPPGGVDPEKWLSR